MKNIFLSSFLTLMLFGCASQIMQGYVGQPIQTVMLDYGPPVNAFDMPDGQRVFQWTQDVSQTTPVNVNTTGNVNTLATGYGATSWVNSNTVITGGQTYTDTCIYSLFANWDKKQKVWIISGFKKPKLMCE
jgi:hypothetical protein